MDPETFKFWDKTLRHLEYLLERGVNGHEDAYVTNRDAWQVVRTAREFQRNQEDKLLNDEEALGIG